jgi:flagellar biogenesis protein FliO
MRLGRLDRARIVRQALDSRRESIMEDLPKHLPANHALKRWLPLGVIGLVAVLAGLVLPQLLPSIDSPSSSSASPILSKTSKDDLTYTPPAWPEAPNHSAVFLRLGTGTVAVLALCVGTLWCCKRWLRDGAAGAKVGGQLRCIESLALGNRCLVHLVRIGNRSVLVGADASGVKTIVPLPESFSQSLLAAEELMTATA